MSFGTPNWTIPTDAANVVIGDEIYLTNQSRINQAQAFLNNWKAMNEEGNKNFNNLQNDLSRKIQEGEDAKYVRFSLPCLDSCFGKTTTRSTSKVFRNQVSIITNS
jgi:hypothetical protein